jgi:hypothetical protein
MLLVLLNSCQKQLDDTMVLSDSNDQTFSLTDDDCGTAMTKDLLDMGGSNLSTGTVVIGNDADKISVRVHAAGEGITVKKIVAVYGSHDHVKNRITETVLWTPCQGPMTPDRVKTSDPGLASDSIHIPLDSFQTDDCVWIGLWVTLTNAEGFEWCVFPSPFDESIPGISIWKTFFKYCRQECEEEEDDCGPLRTQTQGGWGSKPNGNNNGVYLHENFAAAFPDGVTVGCAEKYTVKFTTAQAITDFLPAGGEPGKLKASAVDPADKSIKNVLIGQLTALTLNIGFDG